MITIELTFSKEQLQSLLDAASFGDDPIKVEDLDKEDLAALKYDLEQTDFVGEICEDAYDAVANDWLAEWSSDVYAMRKQAEEV